MLPKLNLSLGVPPAGDSTLLPAGRPPVRVHAPLSTARMANFTRYVRRTSPQQVSNPLPAPVQRFCEAFILPAAPPSVLWQRHGRRHPAGLLLFCGQLLFLPRSTEQKLDDMVRPSAHGMRVCVICARCFVLGFVRQRSLFPTYSVCAPFFGAPRPFGKKSGPSSVVFLSDILSVYDTVNRTQTMLRVRAGFEPHWGSNKLKHLSR